MSKVILVGNANGQIYTYNIITHKLEPYDKPDKRAVMGFGRCGKHLFISSKEMIFRYTDGTPTICKKFQTYSPQFHQLLVHKGNIYITCTAINEIWIFDYDLNLLAKKRITPPNPKNPIVFKQNYNHANSICYHDGLFYVGLNWFTSTQHGKSGVCVLNQNFEEQKRFEYGWQLHGFTFVDNKPYALCATHNDMSRKMNHPRRAGLMVDGKLVFEHSIDVFCKALIVTMDRIYMFGGGIAARHQRGNVSGTIYVLDKEFNLLETHHFDGTGQLCGGMLL